MHVFPYTGNMPSQPRFKVAAVQMDSGSNRDANTAVAVAAVDEAAAHGAQVICLPEHAGCIQRERTEPVVVLSDAAQDPWLAALADRAREHQLYIHTGSLFETVAHSTRARNTSVVLSPSGVIAATYAKLHTFDVTLPDGTAVNESANTEPGTEICAVDTPYGRWGLSICYDIRFCELYRTLALGGAQVLFCPANFTKPTGEAHWELLLRARAVENGCYVVACNQCGVKPEFEAYGNSMVIDPWGTVIARADTAPTIIYADVNLGLSSEMQAKLGSLSNRRPDVYDCF